MKISVSAFALCLLSAAHAQNLFHDFSSTGGGTAQWHQVDTTVVSYYYSPLGISQFQVGMLQSNAQVLQAYWPTQYAFPAEAPNVANVRVYGTGPAMYTINPTTQKAMPPLWKSGVWWNLNDADVTLDGWLLPASSVSLISVDAIPAVQIQLQGATNATHKVTVSAGPIGGTSTPGTLSLMQFSGGSWTTLYSLTLNKATVSDTRTISTPTATRLRWILVRTGSAAAKATLSVNID